MRPTVDLVAPLACFLVGRTFKKRNFPSGKQVKIQLAMVGGDRSAIEFGRENKLERRGAGSARVARENRVL